MIAATEKLAVASELLDRALRMYYEGSSYFAALQLAGAAEEILGVYVEAFFAGPLEKVYFRFGVRNPCRKANSIAKIEQISVSFPLGKAN